MTFFRAPTNLWKTWLKPIGFLSNTKIDFFWKNIENPKHPHAKTFSNLSIFPKAQPKSKTEASDHLLQNISLSLSLSQTYSHLLLLLLLQLIQCNSPSLPGSPSNDFTSYQETSPYIGRVGSYISFKEAIVRKITCFIHYNVPA